MQGAPDTDREESAPEAAASGSRLRRGVLASAGVVFVGLGAVGVVVPGLPTTVFLILAGYCFARSIPALEERLIRTKWFAPYLRYVDGEEEMPLGARVRALLIMWISIGLSTAFLIYRSIHPAVWLSVIAAGLIGTWYIWAKAGRRPQSARRSSAEPPAAFD